VNPESFREGPPVRAWVVSSCCCSVKSNKSATSKLLVVEFGATDNVLSKRLDRLMMQFKGDSAGVLQRLFDRSFDRGEQSQPEWIQRERLERPQRHADIVGLSRDSQPRRRPGSTGTAVLLCLQ